MFEHEHPLSLIELWSKIKHNEEETDEDDVDDDGDDLDYTKQDFRCQCDRCDKEINWFHRYYYKCDQCQYSIHKFCAELPETLQHPSHVCRRRHHHHLHHQLRWTSHKKYEILYSRPECFFYFYLRICYWSTSTNVTCQISIYDKSLSNRILLTIWLWHSQDLLLEYILLQ